MKDTLLTALSSVEYIKANRLYDCLLFPTNKWYPCEPLLQTQDGKRYYLGTAAFLFEDGRIMFRAVYKGRPSESYSDVLKYVIEHLPTDVSQIYL